METRTAIVTGASSGIGLAIARALLARGDAVVGVARRATSAPLEPSPRLALVDGDVGDPATAARAVAEAERRTGRVDLLVNNAGIFIARRFTDYDERDLASLVSTNLAGFVHMTQRAIPPMLARQSGHIVNIGTSLVAQPIAGLGAVLPVLIKGGIEAATRSLAIEYAAAGIRANTIAAGAIDTPLNRGADPAFLRSLSPMNRIGAPDEIARAVLYLDEATFVSGEILHVDGGAHAGKW